jgi:hypothetical protein
MGVEGPASWKSGEWWDSTHPGNNAAFVSGKFAQCSLNITHVGESAKATHDRDSGTLSKSLSDYLMQP